MRLGKALYGHPAAGGAWEGHCDVKLKEIGFLPVPNWSSVYYQKEWDLLLMVYVDDFKMSGPQQNMGKGWKAIRAKLDPHTLAMELEPFDSVISETTLIV